MRWSLLLSVGVGVEVEVDEMLGVGSVIVADDNGVVIRLVRV